MAGNGELLWPREPALAALEWIAQHDLGVVCVEAYGRVGQARGSFERDWPIAPGWRIDEPWERYVARAARQAAATIAGDDHERPEAHATSDGSGRRYFIAVAADDAYPASMREP